MRRLPVYGAAAAIAIGFAAWFLTSERAPQGTRHASALADDRERSRTTSDLWLDDRGAAPAAMPDEPSASVQRRDAETRAGESAPAAAALGFGVRARVLDAGGKPLAGWAVVLEREDPRWRELRSSSTPCEGGRQMSNCGVCHEPPAKSIKPQVPSHRPPFSPAQIAGVLDAEEIVARAVSASGSGEVFFPLEPDDSAVHHVRLECTPDERRACPVAPSDPPPLVDLITTSEELLRVSVVDDETWSVAPAYFHAWASGGAGWMRSTASSARLDPYEVLDLRVETDVPLRVEAWIERPFAPRLLLEPHSSERGRELALDRRDHYARASVRVLDAEGSPCKNATLVARLFEGPAVGEELVTTDGEGRVRLAFGTGVPPAFGRGLTLAVWPEDLKKRPVSRFAIPGETPSSFQPVWNEAHLELSSAFSAGSEVDLGTIRFGEGPLLVAGKVVDEHGRPVANAEVNLFDRDEVLPCDASGRFVRRGFSGQKTLVLRASAAGYVQPKSQRVQLPATDLTLVLLTTASAKLRLLAPRGLLAKKLEVHVEHLDADGIAETFLQDAWSGTCGADGEVRLDGLPTGEMRVSLWAGLTVLHSFRHRFEPGVNDLGVLDLNALVRTLEFRLATGGPTTATIAARSATTAVFDGHVEFEGDGSLAIWVPLEWETWTLEIGERSWRGTVHDIQPIRLD